MNIREMAEQDLALTLEDAENGFGNEITITDPSGLSEILSGQTGDIHLVYDSEADAKVNNRIIHISIRISSLTALGFEIPRSQPDQSSNPWLFEFSDINGNSGKFTVSDSMPDKALGIVTIILEVIKE
jgi:hypothetical protein